MMPKSLHSAFSMALTGAFLVASACSEDDARPSFTPDVERNPLYPSAVNRPPSAEGGDEGQGQAGAAQSSGAGGSSFLPPTGGAGGAIAAGGSGFGAGGTGPDTAAGGSAGADLGAGGSAAPDASDAGLGGAGDL